MSTSDMVIRSGNATQLPASARQEDWKAEVQLILSHSLRQQLEELREHCEGMRKDAKEEIQRFLESAKVTEQGKLHRFAQERSSRNSGDMEFLPARWKPREVPSGSHDGSRQYMSGEECESIEVVQLPFNNMSTASEPNTEPAFFSIPCVVNCSEDRSSANYSATAAVAEAPATDTHSNSKKVAMNTRISANSHKSIGTSIGRKSAGFRKSEISTTLNNVSGVNRKNLRETVNMLDFPPPPEGKKSPTWQGNFIVDAIETLVTSFYFDYVMGLLLAINAIIMGVSVNTMAVNNLQDMPAGFKTVDLVFNIIFTVELLLRILGFRERFLKIDGWRWNAFDVVIVSLSWTHVLINHVNTDSVNLEWTGVVRFMKMGRVARLVRMVRLVPELKSMVYLMLASAQSFVWALMLMMIVIYCMAVYFTELASAGQDTTAPSATKHWGSLSSSILSLYMGITGGDDWVRLIEPFKTNDANYVVATGVFSIYIAFATLVMLNLVTGVFVDSAQRIIREEKDNEFMNLAVKLFFDADHDHSQDITMEEWTEQLDTGHFDTYIKAVGMCRAEARRLFDLLDSDASGTINIAEFVQGCNRLRGPAKAMDVADMLQNMRKQNVESQRQISAIMASIKMMTESHVAR